MSLLAMRLECDTRKYTETDDMVIETFVSGLHFDEHDTNFTLNFLAHLFDSKTAKAYFRYHNQCFFLYAEDLSAAKRLCERFAWIGVEIVYECRRETLRVYPGQNFIYIRPQESDPYYFPTN